MNLDRLSVSAGYIQSWFSGARTFEKTSAQFGAPGCGFWSLYENRFARYNPPRFRSLFLSLYSSG
jgi:hypothetical protein